MREMDLPTPLPVGEEIRRWRLLDLADRGRIAIHLGGGHPAQILLPTPKWTPQPPQVPGLYWFCASRNKEVMVVRVVERRSRLHCVVESGGRLVSCDAFPGAVWSGPIKPMC